MNRLKILFKRWWMILVLAACLPFFYNAAVDNGRSVDYANSGFFTFWLSGHMLWSGGHPYSSAEWVAGHHANGATWIPNQIFPYPLPLALVTAPLGRLPMGQAYMLWGLLSQILVAAVILALCTFWEGLNRRFFAVFIVAAVILNSNVHLMLLAGTIGSLFLVFLLAALYFKRRGWDFAAGAALALMALKPPLLTIVALIGLWLLLRRDWKTIAGGLCGGLALLGIGMAQDVGWVAKFAGASENLFNMRLGSQPTIISYTRLACGGDLTCAAWLYALAALLLVGLYTWLVWKKRETLTPLSVFSAAIALGVLLPPYIWSYDYVLLVIPLCFICFELIRRTSSYIHATLFLLLLDGLSLGAVTLFSFFPESSVLTIQRDMWSIWVAIMVLGVCWGLVFRGTGDKIVPAGDGRVLPS
ncbi:MAG: glycosyltransferase family 87 protein [Anaerolineales bacterium]